VPGTATRFSVRIRAMLFGLVVVVVGGLVTACRNADGPSAAPRSPTTPPNASPSAVAGAPTSTLAETLRRKVDVPKGMRLQILEFGDARHGYAQFISDEPISRPTQDSSTWVYQTAIFAARDGGRTWSAILNPASPGSSPSIFAVGATVMVISNADDSWVSVDGGRTFRHDLDPYPRELDPLFWPFRVGACDVAIYCPQKGSKSPRHNGDVV